MGLRKSEAESLKAAISDRINQCGLELHPDKTKIVYCQDANQTVEGEEKQFDFLGLCFRPRLSRNRKGKYFVNFSPAICGKSKKEIYTEIRQWRLHSRTGSTLKDLANFINPIVRGWVENFGAFFKAELMFFVRHLDKKLTQIGDKYKKQGANYMKADKWCKQVKEKLPKLFAHWSLLRVCLE